MQYFFILGRTPNLSIAEIKAVLAREGIRAQIRHASSEALVLETTSVLGEDFFYGLGGSVKFGNVVATSKPDTITKTLMDFFKKERIEAKTISSPFGGEVRRGESFLARTPSSSPPERGRKTSKFSFGISAYPLEEGVQTGKLRRELLRAGIEIKKELKELGPTRFVTSRESTLSSVVVKTNKVTELVVLQGALMYLVGQTLAVQAFDDLSFRDYGRPGRSARAGMLPPKLARIMINLAECPRDGALLDPFCGSGTVVTEAMLMGYQNIIGSDLDPGAVRATEQNVAWVRSHYPDQTTHAKVEVFGSPVQEISTRVPCRSVAAVVTEPTLGPPRTGRESRAMLEAQARDLASIYSSALAQFGEIIAPHGRIVMVIPTFVVKPIPVRIDLQGIAKTHGFRQIQPITYEREGQWVAREITVFDKI